MGNSHSFCVQSTTNSDDIDDVIKMVQNRDRKIKKQRKRPSSAPVYLKMKKEKDNSFTVSSENIQSQIKLNPSITNENNWRSMSENVSYSLKELKMRKEILKKSVSENEYQTSTMTDLQSIPNHIADKYRVKQLKQNRKRESDRLKSMSERHLNQQRQKIQCIQSSPNYESPISTMPKSTD